MSALIVSDTHGLVYEVKQTVERHRPEAIFHCGDFCIDKGREPFSSMRLVRGNCDTDRGVPLELTTHWHQLKIYQTHGHLYDVKSSLMKLHYRAEEVGANVVLFGHSHFPLCTEERGVLFLNPGSLQLPRGYDVPTYACLEQLAYDSDQVEVEVRFFNHHGEPVTDRGGRFTLRR
ncbi:metallophosphoesterase [Brevibacillus humidisoli]|uniref:metallophosphoesterase family protein n=1 Tax=Brevibacillus humidisoli TaxID=2895522 RepID=UPI001E5B74F0|nr:metallophosphoesterase [Brevibacillus humidisoli]UFJ39092.1 metallophosphoesterase [Brevibacillus humidisoli]